MQSSFVICRAMFSGQHDILLGIPADSLDFPAFCWMFHEASKVLKTGRFFYLLKFNSLRFAQAFVSEMPIPFEAKGTTFV